MRAAIINRLRRLERTDDPAEGLRIRAIVESITESRRRRCEAEGRPYVEEKPPGVDYTGCRTLADAIMRARAARLLAGNPATIDLAGRQG